MHFLQLRNLKTRSLFICKSAYVFWWHVIVHTNIFYIYRRKCFWCALRKIWVMCVSYSWCTDRSKSNRNHVVYSTVRHWANDANELAFLTDCNCLGIWKQPLMSDESKKVQSATLLYVCLLYLHFYTYNTYTHIHMYLHINKRISYFVGIYRLSQIYIFF